MEHKSKENAHPEITDWEEEWKEGSDSFMDSSIGVARRRMEFPATQTFDRDRGNSGNTPGKNSALITSMAIF
ncbi:hypothetical protein ACROYT_G040567 [Oculina patagonica]